MNQIALVGNLTDEPQLKYTQSGAAIASFTVAVSHRIKNNDRWQDVTDGFFRCNAWRSVAENAAHTLKKGMRVLINLRGRSIGASVARGAEDPLGGAQARTYVRPRTQPP